MCKKASRQREIDFILIFQRQIDKTYKSRIENTENDLSTDFLNCIGFPVNILAIKKHKYT